MKEFASQTGGRYTYIDDFLNLQDLALAFVSIFGECENFIVSGCQIKDNKLTPGFVYINGKIRYCSGNSNITKYPVYIYETNNIEKVPYADSGTKIGRKIYGCSVSDKLPIQNDELTGKLPQFIQVTSEGGLSLKDAFFGKYALLLSPAIKNQTINSDVDIIGRVGASKALRSKESVGVYNNDRGIELKLHGNGDYALITSSPSSQKAEIRITSNGWFQFLVNEHKVADISQDGSHFEVPMTLTTLSVGSLYINREYICRVGDSDDDALYINMTRKGDDVSKYLNTIIGNGKNVRLLSVLGKDNLILSNAQIKIASEGNGLILKHDLLSKDSQSLLYTISWTDSNDSQMGYVGYANNKDAKFYIKNILGDVVIDNTLYVNDLYLDNKRLSDVYVSKTDHKDDLKKKADLDKVYSKVDSDKNFVPQSKAIEKLIQIEGGEEQGRKSICLKIGAMTLKDGGKYALKSSLLNDIVNYNLPAPEKPEYSQKLLERQRAICQKIGAAFKTDIDTNHKKTEWLYVLNASIFSQLKCKQVGDVVSIQGRLFTPHSGKLFTLPNEIDPPLHDISFCHNKAGEWQCIIKAGSRDCIVDYCNGGCGLYVGFLMTYLI